MKKVIIKNLDGIQTHGAQMEDPTQWIAGGVAGNWWGKPERWVLHKDKPMAEAYDDADVLEEMIEEIQPAVEAAMVLEKPAVEAKDAVLDEDGNILEEAVEAKEAVYREVSPAIPAVTQKKVKLKAEYTIEIEDITEEHNLQQVIAKRKAEYPSAEEFMNAFFDGGDEAIAALQAKRLEIKQKYPKN